MCNSQSYIVYTFESNSPCDRDEVKRVSANTILTVIDRPLNITSPAIIM